MTFHVILDENVSLRLKSVLEGMGHKVIAVAELPQRGAPDTDVFELAHKHSSLLITRDTHFTNTLRFPPDKLPGIFYIFHGNLRAEDEVNLFAQFLNTHSPSSFSGRLVFLSPKSVRIR